MAGFSFLSQETDEASRSDLLTQTTKSNDYTFIEICIVILTAGALTNLTLTGQIKLATRTRQSEANTLINAGLKTGLLHQKQNFLNARKAAKIWA